MIVIESLTSVVAVGTAHASPLYRDKVFGQKIKRLIEKVSMSPLDLFPVILRSADRSEADISATVEATDDPHMPVARVKDKVAGERIVP